MTHNKAPLTCLPALGDICCIRSGSSLRDWGRQLPSDHQSSPPLHDYKSTHYIHCTNNSTITNGEKAWSHQSSAFVGLVLQRCQTGFALPCLLQPASPIVSVPTSLMLYAWQMEQECLQVWQFSWCVKMLYPTGSSSPLDVALQTETVCYARLHYHRLGNLSRLHT